MSAQHSSNVQRSVDCFMLSNCGYVSDNNEDNFYVSDDQLVLAIADGMGGEPFGEVASGLAVRAVENLWRSEQPANLPEEEHAEWIERAFDSANETILRHGERHTETYGMGTTLVVAVATTNGVTVGNVGDSRAILIDQTWASTITRDHTLNPEEYGFRTSVRRDRTPIRNKGGLTRRIGGDYSVTTDIYPVSVPTGAWLLLCTDGLHGVVTLDEIVELSNQITCAEEFCEALVEAALDGGGPDNVSVVAWRFTDVL